MNSLKARRRRPREVKKIRKEAIQPLAFIFDDADALRVFWIQILDSLQDFGRPGNARQRISDLMRQTCGQLSESGKSLDALHPLEVRLYFLVHRAELFA